MKTNKQEVLQLYREGQITVDEATEQVDGLDHPRRPLWQVGLIFLLAAVLPSMVEGINFYRR